MVLKKLRNPFFVILMLSIVFNVNSQSLIDSELDFLFVNIDSLTKNYAKPLIEAYNETDIIFSMSFLFYKTFISSQDNPSCIFTPSCSEYAVEAFKKKGVIMGWLFTFDRLTRCNGLVHHSHYPFDNEKKLFYDPIE